jgi:WD40 repeat protein
MLTRGLSAALAGLVVLASGAVAAEKPPIAVTASFIDPGSSEQALFSADGKILALPDLGMLWDVAAGLPLRRLSDPVFVTASAFTPDGAIYVTGHKDGAIKLWSVASGAVIATLSKSGDDTTRITSLSTDAKGQFLVSGDHVGTVKVWSLPSRRLVRTVEVNPIKKGDGGPDIASARLSLDGSRLIVLANATWTGPGIVAEYDAKSGAERSWFALPKLHAFPSHGYLDDDKALVQSTADCQRGETKLWNYVTHAFVADIHKPERCDKQKDTYESDAVKIFAGGSSPRVVIAQADKPELLVWDLAARKLERTIRWPDQSKPPNAIGLSHDLKSVAVAEPGVVRIRALDTGASVKDLRGIGPAANYVMMHGPGVHILSQRAHRDGDKSSIDLDLRGDALKPTGLHFPIEGDFTVLDFAPGAKLALAASDKSGVLALPLEPGNEPRKLAVEGLREAWRIWLSPDGKLAGLVGQFGKDAESVNAGGVLIDTGSGKIVQPFPSVEDNDEPRAFAFTADGSKFAVGRRNGKAEIWDVKTMKQVRPLPTAVEDGDIVALTFSPDGQFLAGSGVFDTTVWMWSLATGKVVRTFDLGPSWASYRYATVLAMSHDGKTIAAGIAQRHTSSGDVGSERGNVVVWDAASGKRRFTLRGPQYATYAVGFSADDRFIVGGSLDGTVQYWDRDSGRLMATAMSSGSDGWLVLTESGFYAGSDGSDANVAVVRGTGAIPGTRVHQQLSKPALVENLIKGDGARYRDAARKDNLSAVLKSAAP